MTSKLFSLSTWTKTKLYKLYKYNVINLLRVDGGTHAELYSQPHSVNLKLKFKNSNKNREYQNEMFSKL